MCRLHKLQYLRVGRRNISYPGTSPIFSSSEALKGQIDLKTPRWWSVMYLSIFVYQCIIVFNTNICLLILCKKKGPSLLWSRIFVVNFSFFFCRKYFYESALNVFFLNPSRQLRILGVSYIWILTPRYVPGARVQQYNFVLWDTRARYVQRRSYSYVELPPPLL